MSLWKSSSITLTVSLSASGHTLSPPQQAVVAHRGGHLQVIACAGSGKTESISRRVASLLAEGVDPEAIVAFTFTERAAAELKARILARATDACGPQIQGRLARLYVGTIHGYCHRLLQDHVPSFGNYDVLDEHRHNGLLSREAWNLKLKARLGTTSVWEAIARWGETADVLGNELIPRSALSGPIAELHDDYLAVLARYHCLTFGQLIQHAVDALRTPRVHAAVHGTLRHLFVDEYQDVNPAQEALIRLLGAPPVQVTVVGDDDQAIYQWRGSDVGNLQRFAGNFGRTTSVALLDNRRSRREIVELAQRFAATIPGRLEKTMAPQREADPQAVVPWSAETPEDEAATIAATIAALHTQGWRYRDIGILFRSVRTSAQVLIDALRDRNIPYTCAGRTGLFLQPEVEALARTYIWLAGWEWRPPGFGQASSTDTPATLVAAYMDAFGEVVTEAELTATLLDWQRLVADTKRPVNLISDFYALLRLLKIPRLDPDDSVSFGRLGALARFSNILADFEHVTRRGGFRTKDDGTEDFVGGRDRGTAYYERLANYLLHYARDSYEEFDGEAGPELDAVDLVTVHQAKGLEWPIVFLPSLVQGRFPSKNAGKARDWLLPPDLFTPAARRRYEGGEDDERRLFYVALTRARDTLYLSHFRRQTRAARPSRFLEDLYGAKDLPDYTDLPLPPAPATPSVAHAATLNLSVSELGAYDDCGLRYRLTTTLGFATQLVPELGYGKAIHHILRHLAETARTTGRLPDDAAVEALLDAEFYLPFANSTNFANMRAMARSLVRKYLRAFAADLQRIWATERSFELHLPEGNLAGRADVILDHHDDQPDALAIVDYKTSRADSRVELHAFQLAIYAAAGRAEGLEVQAAWLHHLDQGARAPIPIDTPATEAALAKVRRLMGDLRAAKYEAKPDTRRCTTCEQRRLCRHAPSDPWEDSLGAE